MSSLLPLFRGATALVALSLSCSPVHADSALPSVPAELHANVSSIEDNRSSGPFAGSCRVMLTFVGDEIADTSGILNVRATKAVDELGRDLVPEISDAHGSRLPSWPTGRLSRMQGVATLTLRSPSRRAGVIKSIEGVVELYRPTDKNDGVVTLSDAWTHRDVPLKNATLEKFGIELTCLSEEKAAEARRAAPLAFMGVAPNPTSADEQRRLQLVAAEVARRRALRGMAETTSAPESHAEVPPAAPAPTGNVPPSEATATTVDKAAPAPNAAVMPRSAIALRVKDPQHKVVDVEVRDASGTKLNLGSIMQGNDVVTLTLLKSPPAEAKLVVYVAAPDAVESHPFRLENIALP